MIIGGSFKQIKSEDIQNRRTTLDQLIDVIQEDISGSSTRRTYQVFVTGGVGPGITSSLFQTVYDQDFTLQTANPLLDMTVGIFSGSQTVAGCTGGPDGAGKLLFGSSSVMMREKIDMYRQHAATLLGNSEDAFYAPFNDVATAASRIDEALFLNFKRLFTRDGLRKETLVLRMYPSASESGKSLAVKDKANLHLTSEETVGLFSDVGANATNNTGFGGTVGNIVQANSPNNVVGLCFYERGQVILDMKKVFSGSQHMSGTISAMANGVTIDGEAHPAGFTVLGSDAGNPNAKLIPDFVVSASMDNIIDHIATTRFQSGTLTACTFQNQTEINSTLIFCRATPDEFNYSSNPTYTDSENKLVVIDSGQETRQRSFTFPTTVGLHDNFGNLLAVAKMSRPIEKNDEKDMTFRIRLDF